MDIRTLAMRLSISGGYTSAAGTELRVPWRDHPSSQTAEAVVRCPLSHTLRPWPREAHEQTGVGRFRKRVEDKRGASFTSMGSRPMVGRW